MPKDKELFHGATIADDELFDVTTGEFVQRRLIDFAHGHGPGFGGIAIEGPSLTRQEFAAECDINEIMRRNEPQTNWFGQQAQPVYLDTTDLPEDFRGAMELMIRARESFMELPASVRREFDNDPVAFVDFAADPANLDKMREWKLAPPAPEPPPAPLVAAGAGGGGAQPPSDKPA